MARHNHHQNENFTHLLDPCRTSGVCFESNKINYIAFKLIEMKKYLTPITKYVVL